MSDSAEKRGKSAVSDIGPVRRGRARARGSLFLRHIVRLFCRSFLNRTANRFFTPARPRGSRSLAFDRARGRNASDLDRGRIRRYPAGAASRRGLPPATPGNRGFRESKSRPGAGRRQGRATALAAVTWGRAQGQETPIRQLILTQRGRGSYTAQRRRETGTASPCGGVAQLVRAVES